MDASIKGEPQRFYWKHIQKDGREFDAEVSLNRLETQGANLLQAMVRDITERKQAEEALRENEERFRTLVENIPGTTYRCVCDRHWTMFFISDEVEVLTGYPASDFLQNRVRSFASMTGPFLTLPSARERKKSCVEKETGHSCIWILQE